MIALPPLPSSMRLPPRYSSLRPSNDCDLFPRRRRTQPIAATKTTVIASITNRIMIPPRHRAHPRLFAPSGEGAMRERPHTQIMSKPLEVPVGLALLEAD